MFSPRSDASVAFQVEDEGSPQHTTPNATYSMANIRALQKFISKKLTLKGAKSQPSHVRPADEDPSFAIPTVYTHSGSSSVEGDPENAAALRRQRAHQQQKDPGASHSPTSQSRRTKRGGTDKHPSRAGRQEDGSGRGDPCRPTSSRWEEHTSSSFGSHSSLGPSKLLDDASAFDAAKKEFVLTNRDIHSLEAFLFGIRVLVRQVDEMERSLLAMIHDHEMAKNL